MREDRGREKMKFHPVELKLSAALNQWCEETKKATDSEGLRGLANAVIGVKTEWEEQTGAPHRIDVDPQELTHAPA
ncbi:hypothetical protein NDU88_005856 [Pleurodeles waltl]|uniref:Uncharacterized protein n=1 Tax=Pleurodeles waltl TaxID=8319 RepID=A0AAV7WCM1_PLEWA|nr:hypothetical protein NDU88_005856 [Pleurodeles waltl]